jgi:proteasome assembly chaperone (PAC2) family protein
MTETINIIEIPKADEIFMIVGWRQWADAGAISSGLIEYLVQHTDAKKIGSILPKGFYIFQIPGTHDLVRPIIKFKEGHPVYLESEKNEFFYAGDKKKGVVFFLGDEPHMDADRYVNSILEVVKKLKVKRIISLGGVYGELPYNKERMVSSTYSLVKLKIELDDLSVNLSEYHGGASIGSYLCRRAADNDVEYVSFYGFVPTYDFSNTIQGFNGISIENDYNAWLGIMRRVNHMLNLEIDLTDLEGKSENLKTLMDDKFDEIDKTAPELNIREYLQQLIEEFEEHPFQPLEDFWEEELGRLFDKIDTDEDD